MTLVAFTRLIWHSVAETEEFYTDAHSVIGSDMELESNHVSETDLSSDEEEDNTEFNCQKNAPFQPNVHSFDEPCGLTTEITSRLNENSSPFDIFEYFWDNDLVSEIVDQTNSYVQLIKIRIQIK